MFKNYKSKPSQVEAVLITSENINQVAKEVSGTLYNYTDIDGVVKNGVKFLNAEHNQHYGVKIGSYLCRTSPDDMYPCDHDSFEKRYEPIDPYDASPKPEGIIDQDKISEITVKTLNDLKDEAMKVFDYAHKMAEVGMQARKRSFTEQMSHNIAVQAKKEGFVNGFINALVKYKLVKISVDE